MKKWWRSNLRNVKVGDKLWGLRFGECYVKEITNSGTYPIIISPYGEDAVDQYTLDGRLHERDKFPSLWKKCPFELPPLVERPDFEVNHKVFVDLYKHKHFCRWPEDPRSPGIFVYRGGCTSFTTTKSVYYEDWEDAEK